MGWGPVEAQWLGVDAAIVSIYCHVSKFFQSQSMNISILERDVKRRRSHTNALEPALFVWPCWTRYIAINVTGFAVGSIIEQGQMKELVDDCASSSMA